MFYNLGIFAYGLAIRIAALFNPKAKQWVTGRKKIWNQLPNVKGQNVVWFHCASLGEYDQGKPIMEAWKQKHPDDYLLVTFFSPSGYEYVKDKSVGDYTCYLPLDTPSNAKKFVNHFSPKVTFFIKYEIWINYIKQTKNGGSKLYLISGLFRKKHRFFKWYGGVFRKALKRFDHIFVQNDESKDLLASIDISTVTVSGDTRFDRVFQRASEEKTNEILAPWAKDGDVFVIGSSWPADEEIIIPLINDFKIQNPIIIAPHEVDAKHIETITSQLKVSYQLYTQLLNGEKLHPATLVVILDCIGVLADAYRYGKIAYVGGGFGTGLHNILEPAAFGLPVIFGPEHKKFPEAQAFINHEIGIDIKDHQEFMQAYKYLLKQTDIHQKVNAFVKKNVGATEVVMKVVSELL